MAHRQGDKPTDDPTKFGLKFDSEKPKWELFPEIQLMKIVEVFNMFSPSGNCNDSYIDLKNFDREKLINFIFGDMLEWHSGSTYINSGKKEYQTLAMVGFQILFLIRNKSYTYEELNKTDSYIRFDLIDMKEIEKVVDIFTMGAKKYAPNNWQLVDPERYYGAFMRHFLMVRTNKPYDSELGCLHIHQALWNIIALLWLEDNKEVEGEVKKEVQEEISPKFDGFIQNQIGQVAKILID